MLLFGHPYIDFEPFYHIEEIDAIEQTPPNSTLFIHFNEENLDVIRHMQQNRLSFALEVEDITQAVLAHNLDAKYIIVNEKIAKYVQAVAENYLFDAKVLCRLGRDDDLSEKIIEGIDGVIYAQAIIKISN